MEKNIDIDDLQVERPDSDPDFDRYVSYEDAEGLVICHRSNASAWIRSSDSRSVER